LEIQSVGGRQNRHCQPSVTLQHYGLGAPLTRQMERVGDLLSRISGLVTEFFIGNILGIQEIADAWGYRHMLLLNHEIQLFLPSSWQSACQKSSCLPDFCRCKQAAEIDTFL
jgi:hypothetical protein